MAKTNCSAPPTSTTRSLLDLVQRQTLRYFWEFAHPVSGLARERSNVTPRYGHEACTTGGSGFGVMAIIVGVSRGWITRDDAVARLWTMVRFLLKSDSYHGVWPHFLDGETGRTIPFSRKDDGADLVETSFLVAGLLCARQYFDRDDEAETRLRAAITWMWEEVEWDWHTRDGRNVLYWHWSPNNGWSMNHEIRGWSECLITYVLAASAPAASDLAGDLCPWLDGRPQLPQRPGLLRHYPAAGAGLWRAAGSLALFVSRPRPARPDRSPRRLLAAMRRPHRDQSRALRPQPAWLQGLRAGLLGSDLERQLQELRRAFPEERPRRDRPDRRARLLRLHPGALDAGAPAFLSQPRGPASGASTASSPPSARPPTGSRTRIWRSTRARSS